MDSYRKKMQGLWRRYLLRLMHFGELRTINGISRDIDVFALHLSFLYAPAQFFLRYLQEDFQKDGESKAWHARLLDANPARKHELYDPTTEKDNDKAYQHRRPCKIDRTTFDRANDDYLHPYYDPVFSELPPGERFVIHDGTRKDNPNNNVWKRAKNANLLCPTLPTYDLLHNVEIHGNTSAEKHYEIGLYGALSWIQFYIGDINDLNRETFLDFEKAIATPVPHDMMLASSSVRDLFREVPGKCVKLRERQPQRFRSIRNALNS